MIPSHVSKCKSWTKNRIQTTVISVVQSKRSPVLINRKRLELEKKSTSRLQTVKEIKIHLVGLTKEKV